MVCNSYLVGKCSAIYALNNSYRPLQLDFRFWQKPAKPLLGCKGLRWRAQWPVCSWCSVLLHGVKTCCSALHVLRVSSLRFLPSTAGTRKRASNCRGRIGRVRAGPKGMFGRCAVVGCKLFADVLAHCVLRDSSRRCVPSAAVATLLGCTSLAQG